MKKILILILITVAVTGCASKVKPWIVSQPPDTFQPVPGSFLAGAAEVDITPSPGFPVFGFSTEGTKYALGHWTRLKARIIVFQDSKGKRLAMVQIDWGAVSELLRREVAKRAKGREGGNYWLQTHTFFLSPPDLPLHFFALFAPSR